MPREFSRGRKVGDLIHRELASLIQREVKDPRIGMVTISEANVTRDLALAEIYFTVLPADDVKRTEEALNEAAGFLRSQLASLLNVRTTPKLRFRYDATIEDGDRISRAIDNAIARDIDHGPAQQ